MQKHKSKKPQHIARDFSAKEDRLIDLAAARGCEVWELDHSEVISSESEDEETKEEPLEEEEVATGDPEDPLAQVNTNRQRQRSKKKVEEGPVEISEEDVIRLAEVRRKRDEAAREREEQKKRAEELRKQAAAAYSKKSSVKKKKGSKPSAWMREINEGTSKYTKPISV